MVFNQSLNTDIEIKLLLEAIFLKYGYDFRQYSAAHIKRRMIHSLSSSGLTSISDMQAKIMYDEKSAVQLLSDLSITVTEMFRDPNFYKSLREEVIPILKTYPFIKIWHAGCATGEEVYSMAILLKEENLYDRTTIYATDFNQQALDLAKGGILSDEKIKEYEVNYRRSGGKRMLSDYYMSKYDHVIMNQDLKKNIVWANHNLVTDSTFSEMHLVLCRNVLIYFNRDLQNRVQKLFFDSLVKGGILCLGMKETMRFSDFETEYLELNKTQKIFKKKY